MVTMQYRCLQNLKLMVFAILAVLLPANSLLAEQQQDLSTRHSNQTIANTFAKLIENAIPLEYEKRKDWGKKKNITVGLRNEGIKLYRKKKPVKHGVWKHYRVSHIRPEENFSVQIENLQTVDNNRIAFTMLIDAKLDTWARAKVYQYGVHLVALEMEGDSQIKLKLDCEVGVELGWKDRLPSVTIDPKVTNAKLALSEFHLRRVSNAKGPLVQELSSGLRRLVQHELKGPKLTAKLNRAIDKKRDRLTLSMSQLVDSSWWPLARLPELAQANQKR